MMESGEKIHLSLCIIAYEKDPLSFFTSSIKSVAIKNREMYSAKNTNVKEISS
jgi:hypothetical protein